MIQDWHAHIYFDPEQYDIAKTLHAEWKARYKDMVGKLHTEPVGPHPVGQFRILVLASEFANTVELALYHRSGLDILFHPNTGNDVADHSTHSFWIGNRRSLDLGKL